MDTKMDTCTAAPAVQESSRPMLVLVQAQVYPIKKAPRSRAPSPFTAHAIGGELALLYEDTQKNDY
jgi:hypothetical protein